MGRIELNRDNSEAILEAHQHFHDAKIEKVTFAHDVVTHSLQLEVVLNQLHHPGDSMVAQNNRVVFRFVELLGFQMGQDQHGIVFEVQGRLCIIWTNEGLYCDFDGYRLKYPENDLRLMYESEFYVVAKQCYFEELAEDAALQSIDC